MIYMTYFEHLKDHFKMAIKGILYILGIIGLGIACQLPLFYFFGALGWISGILLTLVCMTLIFAWQDWREEIDNESN